LCRNIVIEARVGRVRASCRYDVRDLIHRPSPFGYGLFACVDGYLNTFLAKALIELGDGGRGWLINERMVDGADGSTSVDAGVTIDREDLGEPLAQPCQRTGTRRSFSLRTKKSAVALKRSRY